MIAPLQLFTRPLRSSSTCRPLARGATSIWRYKKATKYSVWLTKKCSQDNYFFIPGSSRKVEECQSVRTTLECPAEPPDDTHQPWRCSKSTSVWLHIPVLLLLIRGFNVLIFPLFHTFNYSPEHRTSLKNMCPKNEALASNEFIAKCKLKQEQDTPIAEDHDLRNLKEQMEAANLSDGSDDSEETPNGQM